MMGVKWPLADVRVNALAPSYLRTTLVEQLIRSGRIDLDALTQRTPAGRLGQPHEITTLTLFLAPDGADFINGQTIVADDGWSA
ncbi:MAG: SDR family oxidoreductase [Herbaspirillum sp.]